MIRIIRSKNRYGTYHKVSEEMSNSEYKEALKRINKESISILKVPKNTLKIKMFRIKIGLDKDDFIKNMKTIIIEYNIITFKRK